MGPFFGASIIPALKLLGPRPQLDVLAGKYAGFNKPKCKEGEGVNVDSRNLTVRQFGRPSHIMYCTKCHR